MSPFASASNVLEVSSSDSDGVASARTSVPPAPRERRMAPAAPLAPPAQHWFVFDQWLTTTTRADEFVLA